MELIDNVSKTLKQDLQTEIKAGSRITIAASCFSIYAFQELKELRQAQTAYNRWAKLPAEERTTKALLDSLSFFIYRQ